MRRKCCHAAHKATNLKLNRIIYEWIEISPNAIKSIKEHIPSMDTIPRSSPMVRSDNQLYNKLWMWKCMWQETIDVVVWRPCPNWICIASRVQNQALKNHIQYLCKKIQKFAYLDNEFEFFHLLFFPQKWNLLDTNVSGRRPHRRIAMQPTIVNIKRKAPIKMASVFESHVAPDNWNTSTA